MKLPSDAIIQDQKITKYLLVFKQKEKTNGLRTLSRNRTNS